MNIRIKSYLSYMLGWSSIDYLPHFVCECVCVFIHEHRWIAFNVFRIKISISRLHNLSAVHRFPLKFSAITKLDYNLILASYHWIYFRIFIFSAPNETKEKTHLKETERMRLFLLALPWISLSLNMKRMQNLRCTRCAIVLRCTASSLPTWIDVVWAILLWPGKEHFRDYWRFVCLNLCIRSISVRNERMFKIQRTKTLHKFKCIVVLSI